MPMTPREMVRLLKKYGFEEVRQNGTSHLQMKNPITGKQTTIPMHNRDLGKGLEQAILKQAGIEKDR
ncbi:type II toxin-antitoxin system HicA family toxin [Pumilibacter muris]|uniref:type II toxin-antitoxin system HicA family toxin n=1 Tax=Pumilibacter muris TaxID=2941510 RepID=UPI00203C41C9|nr:type II toxin-antitoxin system HicA family toxin [Pumilibacter muris]